MNILGVFYSPKKTIIDAMNKPSLGLSVVLVLAPAVLALIGNLVYGMKIDFVNFILLLISLLVVWLAFSLVLMFLGYVFGVREKKRHFAGVASSFALVKVLSSAFVIVMMLFIPLTVSGKLLDLTKQLNQGELGTNEFAVQFAAELQQNPNSINLLPLVVFALIAFALFILSLYMYYVIVREFTEFTGGKAFIVWLILIALMLFFSPTLI
ncbi:MAG: hypothetical protein AB1467_02870 [Candidatus Diapherotrites archaeon]